MCYGVKIVELACGRQENRCTCGLGEAGLQLNVSPRTTRSG